MTTHVAFFAACVVVFSATACGASGDGSSTIPATITFRDAMGGVDYGRVDVSAVPHQALEALRDAAPTDPGWHTLLAVHVGDTTGLPMLGSYEAVGDTLRFRPRFAPMAGATYVARYTPGSGNAIAATWTVPSDSGPATTVVTTVVTAVYPSGDVVPMNLLRMYIEFSAPMTTGGAWDHVRLYADGDSLVSEPFFTAGETVELWDPDKRRLTVLFDPGRIKRDLRPREEEGLPLRTGHRYRLVVSADWPDAAGRPLKQSHEKRFRVAGMDRSLVRVADWKVSAPRAGTLDSLVISLQEPLDRALLDRMLVVRDGRGQSVAGTVTVSMGETRWTFTPRAPWPASTAFVDVDTELEDLAGNNLQALFDVAPGDTGATGRATASVRVPFTPR